MTKWKNIKRNIYLFAGAALLTATLAETGLQDTLIVSAEEAASETEQEIEVTTIIAATKGSPTPYMTIDENNEVQGSDIDIIRAVFDRLPQYELEIIVADDPLTGLTSGLYDIAVNNYGWREERGETYYYSYPYKVGYDVYIQRIDDEPLTGLQDLADRGYKIEVGAGSLKASALEAWNEENPDHQINIVYSEGDFQTKFQNIIDGKTDVAIDDGPILDTLITQFGMENDIVGNPIDEDTQSFISPYNGSYFLFAKDENGAALREEVNEVLKELKEDGTLAEITTEYFGQDTSPDEENYETTLN
ncbi:MAG: transporter substrate-binding domain-containing protein [Lachnospiraceae bacterium]|nr:transporter substrate-binding domain-containing protein [Lachnospiraceae bacterium]